MLGNQNFQVSDVKKNDLDGRGIHSGWKGTRFEKDCSLGKKLPVGLKKTHLLSAVAVMAPGAESKGPRATNDGIRVNVSEGEGVCEGNEYVMLMPTENHIRDEK